MYSLGNIDVRNWVHLFESRCIWHPFLLTSQISNCVPWLCNPFHGMSLSCWRYSMWRHVTGGPQWRGRGWVPSEPRNQILKYTNVIDTVIQTHEIESIFMNHAVYPTRCNFTQFILSENCSTCFGLYLHPSSGAQTTVPTASSICQTVIATCR